MTSQVTIQQMCMKVFEESYRNYTQVKSSGMLEAYILKIGNTQLLLHISLDANLLQFQYAISQKLWQKMPMARFINAVHRHNNHQYFAFLEYRQGNDLLMLDHITQADQAQLGYEMGEYLALLHSQKLNKAGKFSTDLKITQEYDLSIENLNGLFTTRLNLAVELGYVSRNQASKTIEKFGETIVKLDDWPHHHCLIHSELIGENIYHKDGHISNILNWQNCMSGHPVFDFTKFTRPPYSASTTFMKNLCDSYYITHKDLPPNWEEIAKCVDLLVWAKLLTVPNLASAPNIKALKYLQI